VPRLKQLLQSLRTARQRAGLTVPQLAEQVSPREGFVERYERGQDQLQVIRAQPGSGRDSATSL
jgi:ribosome-binding protein aMBF1 (putative translation factor)